MGDQFKQHGKPDDKDQDLDTDGDLTSQKVPIRERLHHFTFAWYTVTMSTGGIALLLSLTPHRFTGLDVSGLVIFAMDMVFFLFITTVLLIRFVMYPIAFSKALTHPAESLFISTFFLSIAAMLSNIQEYGVRFLGSAAWLTGALRVGYWAYLAVTFLVSVGQYYLLFTAKAKRRLTLESMTPGWILPIFPVMLAGTLAGLFSPSQPPDQAISMIAAGLAAQGLGLLVSVFMYSTYLSRLMAFGLPVQRPGMFIAVGPPSFTAAALVAIGGDVPRLFGSLSSGVASGNEASFLVIPAADADMVANALRLAALAAAVFLWGLSFWFFVLALAATCAGMPDAHFHLSWWSFVFPNVGFSVASIRIGQAVGSGGVLWMGTAMTIMLVCVWGIVAFRCARAVLRREIVWPGRDEDSD